MTENIAGKKFGDENYWDFVQQNAHKELKTINESTNPCLILMNEQIGLAADSMQLQNDVFEKVLKMISSLQERTLSERTAHANKVRDLQTKLLEAKKVRSTEKRIQESNIYRSYMEKLVGIEADQNDLHWLNGALNVMRAKFQKKGVKMRDFQMKMQKMEVENEIQKSAKEYCRKEMEVATECGVSEESKKNLRRLWDEMEKKRNKKDGENSEMHKEIFSLIESLNLLSDTPANVRNIPEPAKKISTSSESTDSKETPAAPTPKPAESDIEKVENYSKRLEISTNLMKEQHRLALEKLKEDYVHDMTDAKEKFENYKKKYEEEAKKVKERDREILELKCVKDSVITKLSKATKTNKRVEGMIFLSENIQNIYNSIEYKDGVVASLDLRLRTCEKSRVAEYQSYLQYLRDMKMAFVSKYEPNNAAMVEAINHEYSVMTQSVSPLHEQIRDHKVQMEEYRRNEIWLNETRKCMEINEEHLKKFAAKVPRTVNRLKYGDIDPDSVEAQMLDVQAWARECYRFKTLNDILLKQRKKLDAEMSKLVSENNRMTALIANLEYRHRATEAVTEERLKALDEENSKILEWLMVKILLGESVVFENGVFSLKNADSEDKDKKTDGDSGAAKDSEAGAEAKTNNETVQSAIAKLRLLYYKHETDLLNAVANEIHIMRDRKSKGLPLIDPSNTERLAKLAVPLAEHKRIKMSILKLINKHLTARMHQSFLVNSKDWRLNDTVEKRMINEMDAKIRNLETNLAEISAKLEVKEKELVDKDKHIAIVEGVYLRGRYGTPRVQVSAGRML